MQGFDWEDYEHKRGKNPGLQLLRLAPSRERVTRALSCGLFAIVAWNVWTTVEGVTSHYAARHYHGTELWLSTSPLYAADSDPVLADEEFSPELARMYKEVAHQPWKCGDGSPRLPVLYVLGRNLAQFHDVVLPDLGEFVLVTGGGDGAVCRGYLEEDQCRALLDHASRWFSTDATAPEIVPLPIGVYDMRAWRLFSGLRTDHMHDFSFDPRQWHETLQAPLAQEQELLAVRDASPPLPERVVMAYADFQFNAAYSHDTAFHGSRRHALESLQGNPNVFWQESRLRRKFNWAEKAKYAFDISPFGNGIDCYRAWESLALGMIPIVHQSELDRLYQPWPIVIVQDWSEITEDNLRRWLANSMQGKHPQSELRFAGGMPDALRRVHWERQIHEAAGCPRGDAVAGQAATVPVPAFAAKRPRAPEPEPTPKADTEAPVLPPDGLPGAEAEPDTHAAAAASPRPEDADGEDVAVEVEAGAEVDDGVPRRRPVSYQHSVF